MLSQITKLGFSLVLFLFILIVLAVMLPPAEAPLPGSRRDLVIRNVHVVDVEEGRATGPTSVTIRAGKIAAIEAMATADGLLSLDADGGYLIPGLWNMHVHSFQLSPQLHMPALVAHGITSVRDMLDCPAARDRLIACVADKRRWNRAVADGRLAGPRFVSVASYYFEGPGLTPEDASQRARDAASRGVDELKVYNRLSRAAFASVAEEARRSDLRLVGHLPKFVSLEEALRAGQRSFEHAHLFPRTASAKRPNGGAGCSIICRGPT